MIVGQSIDRQDGRLAVRGQAKYAAGFELPNMAYARVDATYQTPIEHHDPMEQHAALANWTGDRLTIWTATQGITGARETVAGLFGGDVTIICPLVGGGFGSKRNTWPPATFAAMAARRVRRPVTLEVTREQTFTSNSYRPRTIQRIRLGAGHERP